MLTVRFGEYSTLAWFILLVALWVLREPRFMPGWGDFFLPNYVTDATSAMLIATCLFFWPRTLPQFGGA